MRDRTQIFFRKISYAPNTEKMGQNWAKNRIFLILLKKLVLDFYWICSIRNFKLFGLFLYKIYVW